MQDDIKALRGKSCEILLDIRRVNILKEYRKKKILEILIPFQVKEIVR